MLMAWFGIRRVFTWKNLTYTVKKPSGVRVLLDNVEAYIKPGMLGALMGSSGAGKTTLLDVLAQRETDGTIRGSILVDGRPLTVAFQRRAKYCEQLDFSALFRQPYHIPRQEKLAYVDTIIKLLELEDIANMLLGKVFGAGLSIEQRKRVTIGVELVAKPSVLIFLNEPRSGLIGQSAFNTVRFLRKLADVGQAILATIHQPSAQLFRWQDSGDNAATIKEYFAQQGLVCRPEVNPAEYMIDVTSGHLSQGRDWNNIWLESPECALRTEELDHITVCIATASEKPPATDSNDSRELATPLWEQVKIVTQRMNVVRSRITDYVNNTLLLHVVLVLFNQLSFWNIGPTAAGLQLRLFTIFNFLHVSPDIPYLMLSGVLYFACWYYTVGFPHDPNKSGATLFVMLMYEFIYTGIGQCFAASAPNAVFVSLANPIFLGILVQSYGALVPYSHIMAFWRYWMYYLNPFNYVMGSILFAVFDPPAGQTCEAYHGDYLQNEGSRALLTNPTTISACRVCQY
ncbi:P-loop containing nucleoside triphosphate hydrolase protein [Aspergillus carlsbadensis]|nr:P-loop containing nucleoside triphosphate hydrolase protein [Aspergillus carlsbadensis]